MVCFKNKRDVSRLGDLRGMVIRGLTKKQSLDHVGLYRQCYKEFGFGSK